MTLMDILVLLLSGALGFYFVSHFFGTGQLA